jgi:hypothetical protein
MNRKEALDLLRNLKDMPLDVSHSMADEVLCDLLDGLGYEDVVEAFKKTDKVYESVG